MTSFVAVNHASVDNLFSKDKYISALQNIS
jgi:hypothetical protein